MRILLTANIHGATEKLRQIIDAETVDGILCAGDLSDATWFDDYAGNLDSVLTIFSQSDTPVKAVPGNTDPKEACVTALRSRDMNLHNKTATFDQFRVAGYGGAIGRTEQPFDPPGEEIKEGVEALHATLEGELSIAVIHQPPIGTRVDLTDDGINAGDTDVRTLFEQTDFDLAVTGHIHEARGQDELNGTHIINPGAAMDGFYAIATITDQSIKIEMKEV